MKKEKKYWICDFCASIKKLKTKYPSGGNTVSLQKCDWCNKEEYVTPIIDYVESGNKDWD